MSLTEVKENPKILKEVKLGGYYVSKASSLRVDENFNTLWLDLESKDFNLNQPIGGINFHVMRNTYGKNNDFVLSDSSSEILNAVKLLNNFSGLSLIDRFKFLLNPEMHNNQDAQKYLNDIKNTLSENSLDFFKRYSEILPSLNKEAYGKLLNSPRYTLLLGSLDVEEQLKNKVETQEGIKIKKVTIDEEIFASYFKNVIIDQKIKNDLYMSMGIPEILSQKAPNTGGALLIDFGGTGKSLLKKSIRAFFESQGSTVVEKDQGDVSSYVNSGPQLIKTWYRGGVMDGFQGQKKPEIDLVQKAIENEIPSVLIIDEAEDFIKENKNGRENPLGNTKGALKRFIQDVEKGGVTGYVLTLLLANIESNDIHEPLKQGAERLTEIYVGPPKDKYLWLEIFNLYFKDLKFKDETLNLDKLADLLLYHNLTVNHENFSISPRRFSAFASKYYITYSKHGNSAKDDKTFFKQISTLLNRKYDIDFNDFIKNFIEDVLIPNLENDSFSKDEKEEIKKKYSNFLNIENKPILLNKNSKTYLEDFNSIKKLISNIFIDENIDERNLPTARNSLQSYLQSFTNKLQDLGKPTNIDIYDEVINYCALIISYITGEGNDLDGRKKRIKDEFTSFCSNVEKLN